MARIAPELTPWFRPAHSWSSPAAGAVMSYAPRNDTWVEKRIDQVEDERRESNGDDQNEYNSLHQEIVRALNSLEQQRADARVTEHDLDKHGTGYQLTERERKCGGLRKHRVSYAVVGEYGAVLQTFRLGEGDIILAMRGHHIRPLRHTKRDASASHRTCAH